ncbi:ribonuclease H-like domain-containing protein, partial [Tanacetum coccineum]
MKPFRCLVTISNTRDYLGKFKGKDMRDFLLGTIDNIVTGQSDKNKEPEQEYILIPFCTTDLLISQGPKDSEEDSRMKPIEVDVESGASDKDGEDDQATRSDTTVSAAGPSFTNDDLSSPVNAAKASNAFEEHLFEQFSPFKNAFTLLPISNVTPMDDTGIFGNAYDNEDMGADADLNNLETTINDERGIVVRNRERLVAQGYTQEEGIDYDEVFAPVARIEAIRLFLAYASFMGFIVYQMDVKSSFLYGTIKEEKFDFATVKTASTPMGPNKALVKDEEADSMDVYLYRSMIRSLMYLTASRPDITFVVCACA